MRSNRQDDGQAGRGRHPDLVFALTAMAAWTYPPIGYYYPELPPEYTTTEVNENTYYYAEGVYYQEGEEDGQDGYVVAETPEEYESGQQKDPFQMFKDMCECLAGLAVVPGSPGAGSFKARGRAPGRVLAHGIPPVRRGDACSGTRSATEQSCGYGSRSRWLAGTRAKEKGVLS